MGVAVSLVRRRLPTATSQLVAKGMLNGTRRHSLTDPEPLEPGVVEELTIDVDATGWRFLPGHRMRVSIAAADWPNVWPTPEIGTLTVHHGPARPIAADPAGRARRGRRRATDLRAVTGRRPPRRGLRATRRRGPSREDALTGRMAVTVQLETAHDTPQGSRIERDSGCVCEVDPRDPAHAIARGWHRCSSTVDGHSVTSSADVVLAGDADDLHLTIDLAVTVDDDPPVTRRWVERIPRVLL